MEPSRTRTARDLAAAEARSRPSTQFASQYPRYPEQAQQFHPRRPQPAQPLPTPPAPTPAAAAGIETRQRRAEARPRVGAPRRLLGVAAFAVCTGLSLPVHILAVFFVYVQVESPGDLASAVPLIAGMLVAVFAALLVTGVVTQVVGGFPGRWRARVSFAALSGVIGLGVAYFAAITQF